MMELFDQGAPEIRMKRKYVVQGPGAGFLHADTKEVWFCCHGGSKMPVDKSGIFVLKNGRHSIISVGLNHYPALNIRLDSIPGSPRG